MVIAINECQCNTTSNSSVSNNNRGDSRSNGDSSSNGSIVRVMAIIGTRILTTRIQTVLDDL